jgi:hypothetical protein
MCSLWTLLKLCETLSPTPTLPSTVVGQEEACLHHPHTPPAPALLQAVAGEAEEAQCLAELALLLVEAHRGSLVGGVRVGALPQVRDRYSKDTLHSSTEDRWMMNKQPLGVVRISLVYLLVWTIRVFAEAT